MQFFPPRKPGKLHLGSDQSAGGLRREKQPETGRFRRCGNRLPLQPEFDDRISAFAGRREVEQARMLGTDRSFLNCGLVPLARLSRGEWAGCGEHRVPQDRMRQSQINAAFHPHTRGKQRWIPARRVIPHPRHALG